MAHLHLLCSTQINNQVHVLSCLPQYYRYYPLHAALYVVMKCVAYCAAPLCNNHAHEAFDHIAEDTWCRMLLPAIIRKHVWFETELSLHKALSLASDNNPHAVQAV